MILLSYLVGTVVLFISNAPLDVNLLMLCYFTNTLFAFSISLFWKISIHSIGVAGPAAALIFVIGYLSIIPILVIPLVMWSRVRLKEHTSAQVLAGAASGLVLTAMVFMLFK